MPPELYFVDAEQPRAGLVFVHGQGDHVRRHSATFRLLAARGISVAAPELPGHGEAAGRRGHIPGLEAIDAHVDAARDALVERAGRVPLGIAGHSMGGLLVADRFARGLGSEFRWVWLSSPLIEAGHGKPAWLIGFGRWLSKFWPSLTIPTGVRPGDNVEGGGDLERIARELASGTHNRISVGWGTELMRASERVASGAPQLFGERPVLVTHGDMDRVCPHRYSRQLFEKLPSPDKRFIEIPGGRHEPWHDEEVADGVAGWMASRAARAEATARPESR